MTHLRRRRSWLGFVCLSCFLFILPSSDAASSIRKQLDDDKPATPVVTENSPIVTIPGDPPAQTPTPVSDTINSIRHEEQGDEPIPPAASTALNTPVRSQMTDVHQDFLDWCAAAGIRTNLTIQTFEYADFQKAQTQQKFAEGNDDDYIPPSETYPILHVRGLAAMQDIQKGEVVISIPLSCMITVATTIDGDPVLGKVMGPAVRSQYDWEDEFYELALLTVAMLYHRSLGKASHLYNYISILETSPTDNIPFLWTKARLQQEAPDGVRRHARGIHKDIQEAYVAVMVVLKREYPELFLADTYSLNNFLWAFAMVNSRHWHLPIPDLHKKPQAEPENLAPQQGIGDHLPPASIPTDAWMSEQGDTDDAPTEAHSFLAPVADLLNFGPPCTRGSYNAKTQTFELIATCSFLRGQEVTYWYTDDCDDIVIANYGFTHPMVPACPTIEDLRQEVAMWTRRSQNFETELGHVYTDLEALERELARAHEVLKSCDCDDAFEGQRHKSSSKSRKQNPAINKHDRIRGSNQPPDYERHGIRRKAWNHQKSDIGL